MYQNNNRKGKKMKWARGIFGSLAILLLTTWLCVAVYADGLALEGEDAEVLSTLEQRMQKRISVNFRATNIDDVIRIMAEQADVDIVKSPKVVGEVTTTLTNVPLSEALTNILAAHNYGYVTSKNMIRIAPMDEINERSEVLQSRIYRITYADVEDVEKALKKFISKRGSISSNSGTSNIIVTDTESKIKAIDTFIAEIDRMTPQILVETRIYDITCTDRLDLGVEWQVGRKGTSATDTFATDPTTGPRNPFASGIFSGTNGKTDSMNGLVRFGWLNSAIDIDILLKAQKQVVNAKLLANPRVLVLDNESANLDIIREIPYQEITESSDGGSIGTTAFREVGVALKVTPHVTRNDMVRLHIIPEFSVEAGEVEVPIGNSSLSQPQVDRRKAESTLLLKSGQTMVLGGLRKKEVAKQVNKIPLLGDIPIVGWAFKSTAEETIFSEMVVFVTPYIVSRPGLSESEKKIYQHTEFDGPCPTTTQGEVNPECVKEDCSPPKNTQS